MKKKFNHIILTPFNFYRPQWGINALSDDWMEKRIKIFKDVTYQSMMSQTNMNYSWIVALDYNTPCKWISEFKKFEYVSFVYVHNTQDLWKNLVSPLLSYSYLITTRIDNDDALSMDFIESIQTKFNPLNLGFINFLNGLTTDGIGRLYAVKKPSNPFISYMEHVGAEMVKTVRSCKHEKAKYMEGFRQIRDTAPLWMVYVHGGNKGNSLPKGSTYASTELLDRFDVNLPIKEAFK